MDLQSANHIIKIAKTNEKELGKACINKNEENFKMSIMQIRKL